jgi:purine-binding chemotaxis protein CheW
MATLETPSAPAKTESGAGARKYLTFVLGHESYGVGVLKVREIIRMLEITAVPQMPTYVKGVINLRGKVVAVVDLRIKFGLAKAENTERTCIVVVEIKSRTGAKMLMGMIVDAVEEVVTIPPSDIEPTPDFGGSISTEYILGMAKIRGSVKTLLDIDQVLTAENLNVLADAVASH